MKSFEHNFRILKKMWTRNKNEIMEAVSIAAGLLSISLWIFMIVLFMG